MITNDKGAKARSRYLVNLAPFSSDEGFKGKEKSFNISLASGEPKSRFTIYMKDQ